MSPPVSAGKQVDPHPEHSGQRDAPAGSDQNGDPEPVPPGRGSAGGGPGRGDRRHGGPAGPGETNPGLRACVGPWFSLVL